MAAELRLDRDGATATLWIDRPGKRNALTYAMWRELPGLLEEVEREDAIRVLILRGAGDTFAAGADISEFRTLRADAAGARVYNQAVAEAERALVRLPIPTLAMVRGHCIGGGCELAVACDLRVADTTARFAITAAKLGIVYGFSSTRRLVALVGPARAKYLLFSARQIDAERALRIGLVDELCSPAELEEWTLGFARSLCDLSQSSIRAAKAMVERTLAGQYEDDETTLRMRLEAFDSADYTERVAAFLERRPPVPP